MLWFVGKITLRFIKIINLQCIIPYFSARIRVQENLISCTFPIWCCLAPPNQPEPFAPILTRTGWISHCLGQQRASHWQLLEVQIQVCCKSHTQGQSQADFKLQNQISLLKYCGIFWAKYIKTNDQYQRKTRN